MARIGMASDISLCLLELVEDKSTLLVFNQNTIKDEARGHCRVYIYNEREVACVLW